MSITYRCDICGKEFRSEYYQGGYIDHVNNFAEYREEIVRRGAEHCAEEILFHGNDLRAFTYDRLNCFLKWDNVDEKLAQEVKGIVEKAESNRKKAMKLANDIVDNIPNDLTKMYVLSYLSGNDMVDMDGLVNADFGEAENE